MKQVHLTDRDAWRAWLAAHHARESVVWLVFHRKETGKPSIAYEAAVEEALCYGWIDSIVKKIDDTRYARKFTPRKPDSNWSALNKARAERMIAAGRMTAFGAKLIEAARENGRWDAAEARPRETQQTPVELVQALGKNRKAREGFDKLTPSCKRLYIGWIAAAKREETRQRRAAEAVALLAEGKKLGMK